jgi:hypothetical protein
LGQGGLVSVEALPVTVQEQLPRWMPDGFGLAGAWLTRDGNAEIEWWDGSCRMVSLWSKLRSDDSVGPARVGRWTLRYDVRRGCGNAVLGSARCVGYFANIEGRFLTLQTIGLGREEADRLALSVPG